jgi:glycerol-3-phosphate acyltransferase PlsY
MANGDQTLWLIAVFGSLPWIANAVAAAFGYLAGSIPFGLILARLGGAGDIRKIGSGNIGATNVLRTGRRGLAALTLALDAAKGFTPAVLSGLYLGGDTPLWAGLGAFVGHVFPVWLGFRGGKGVATYLGVLAAFWWPAAIAFCGIWLAVAAVTRYSSLAALTGASLTSVAAIYMAPDVKRAVLIVALSAILFIRHKSNIEKLVAGHESRIKLGGERTPV